MSNLTEKDDAMDLCIEWLEEQGATIDGMAEVLLELQTKYIPGLTKEMCKENIVGVLKKREVQHAVMTGLELDRLAEEGLLREPLLSCIQKDYSLYGVDENLSLGICHVFGSISYTNFGYLDRLKPGILGELDSKNGKRRCSTFIDDIACALIASAASRMAHGAKKK